MKAFEPFPSWLRRTLDQLGVSPYEFANQIDVFRGTVGRWLMPVHFPNARRPDAEHQQRIADWVGVPIEDVRLMVQMEPRPNDITDVQWQLINLVPYVPDRVLEPVYAALRVQLDREAETLMAELLAKPDADEAPNRRMGRPRRVSG